MKLFLFLGAACVWLGSILSAPAAADMLQRETSAGPLTLEQALQRLQENYSLQINEQEMAIQAALQTQAGLGPNPSLNLMVEEYPSFAGNTGEFNLQWQQPWALSGRQQREQHWVQLQGQLARLNLQQQHLRLQCEVTQAFYTVLARQTHLQMMDRILQTTARMEHILSQQYQAGKMLPAEWNRARLFTAELQQQRRSLQQTLDQARIQLAQHLNQAVPDFERVSGELSPALPSGPRQANSQQLLQQHPEWSQAQMQTALQQAFADWQKSLAWPDPSWSLGLRYLPFENNLGGLGGVNVPLPVQNANQGNIAAAQVRLEQARLSQQALALHFANRLQQALNTETQLRQQIKAQQQELIPLAEQTLHLSQISYQAGKTPYLAVLDARRSLYSMQQQGVMLWLQWHLNQAELRYLGVK